MTLFFVFVLGYLIGKSVGYSDGEQDEIQRRRTEQTY